MVILASRLGRAARVAALLAAGCGPSTPAPAPPASPGPTAVPAATVVTLARLEHGDRACYVVVDGSAGEQSLPGAFALCPGNESDASALIGRRVTYTTEPASVLAASCEGNPDCGKSDQVDLVTTISPVP